MASEPNIRASIIAVDFLPMALDESRWRRRQVPPYPLTQLTHFKHLAENVSDEVVGLVEAYKQVAASYLTGASFALPTFAEGNLKSAKRSKATVIAGSLGLVGAGLARPSGSTTSRSHEPQRIRRCKRPSTYIPIGVDPTTQPYRIALHIPPDRRVVIAEVVVVQAGLRVKVLPREPQVEGNYWLGRSRLGLKRARIRPDSSSVNTASSTIKCAIAEQ